MSEAPGPPPQQPPSPPPVGPTPAAPPPAGPPTAPPWLPAAPPAGAAWAQNIPGGMYFDPTSGLTLPNGTALAGVGRRIGAYFLSIPLFIVTLGIGYLVWGLILWSRGQTPTYQVLDMRVWRPETGRVAGWWWMALREVVGRLIVESVTLIGLVSFILFLATNQRRALHDYIAGTIVLHDPNKVLS